MLAAGEAGTTERRIVNRPSVAGDCIEQYAAACGSLVPIQSPRQPKYSGATLRNPRKTDPMFALMIAADKAMVSLRAKPDAEGFKRIGAVYTGIHHFDRAAEAYGEAAATRSG